MNKKDLKKYKYNQRWIQGRLEYIEEYKTSILNITSIISDMPKRKQNNKRRNCRENCHIIR